MITKKKKITSSFSSANGQIRTSQPYLAVQRKIWLLVDRSGQPWLDLATRPLKRQIYHPAKSGWGQLDLAFLWPNLATSNCNHMRLSDPIGSHDHAHPLLAGSSGSRRYGRVLFIFLFLKKNGQVGQPISKIENCGARIFFLPLAHVTHYLFKLSYSIFIIIIDNLIMTCLILMGAVRSIKQD